MGMEREEKPRAVGVVNSSAAELRRGTVVREESVQGRRVRRRREDGE
jgi:hypothetical protein